MPISEEEWQDLDVEDSKYDEVLRFFQSNPDLAMSTDDVVEEFKLGEMDDPQSDGEAIGQAVGEQMGEVVYYQICDSLVYHGELEKRSAGEGYDKKYFRLV